MLSIGKYVKGAGGFHRYSKTQLLQAANRKQAALVVNFLHAGHILTGMFQGGNAGLLHHGVGRNKKVLMQLLHGPDKRFGCNDISETEPGHGKLLGKPIEHKGMVGKLQN